MPKNKTLPAIASQHQSNLEKSKVKSDNSDAPESVSHSLPVEASIMDDEASVLYCSNCQREIPCSNYQMHVVHCQRNIQLCPKCQEPVPRSELSSHDLEYHTEIKCKDCLNVLESSSLDDHKANNCPKRQQTCRYCDLDLRADDMLEHTEYCGARTESCEICHKLVMMKYQQMHEESGHRITRPDEGEKEDERDDDGAHTVGPENVRNGYVDRYGRPATNFQHGRANVRYPRERFDIDYDLDESLQNLELEHARNTATIRPHVMPELQGEGLRNTNWQINTMIPCEFCEIPIVADELVLHQTGCRPDLSSIPIASRSQENKDGNKSPSEYPRESRRNTSFRPPSFQNDTILIPCEFCHKPLNLDLLTIHQSACQNRRAIRSTSRYGYYDEDDD